MLDRIQHSRQGRLITFEGPEGAGKSTQIRLLAEYLTGRGFEVVSTREPGGTPLAEHLRSVVKTFDGTEKLHGVTELLLIEAARSQHVLEVIRPALMTGKMVLCDRYIDSTTAYQGFARGLELEAIEWLNRFATAGCIPDLTLLFDLCPEDGFVRATDRVETKGQRDRFESEGSEFHRLVREGFLKVATQAKERIRIIPATGTIDEVRNSVREAVDELIRRLSN